MLNKIKNNKALKIIGNIIYYILLALVILILAVVILQRVSKNNASIGGIRIFNIVTESMFPEYQIGDVLISKKIEPSKIKVGDDLVYLGTEQGFAGRVVTHRVVDIEESDGKYRFHTKGLANEVEDPVVQENQIYGIVIYKTYILSFITKIINNIYGFYFLIFIPLTILIIVKFVKIRNEKEKDDFKENEIDKK
ncbi:MAG: signal peptidase I [Clostridia bacterium]